MESLSDKIIPINFRKLHNVTLAARDKVYAHTDLEGSPYPAGNLSVDVIYMVEDRRRGLWN
jgi:hypothetical protein